MVVSCQTCLAFTCPRACSDLRRLASGLPQSLRAHLRNRTAPAEAYADVTILVSSIVGFSEARQRPSLPPTCTRERTRERPEGTSKHARSPTARTLRRLCALVLAATLAAADNRGPKLWALTIWALPRCPPRRSWRSARGRRRRSASWASSSVSSIASSTCPSSTAPSTSSTPSGIPTSAP